MRVLHQYCETVARGLFSTTPRPGWMLILVLSGTGFFGGLGSGFVGALIEQEFVVDLVMGPAFVGAILGVSAAAGMVFSSSLWLRMAISASLTLALTMTFGSLDFAFGMAWVSLGLALAHDFYSRMRHSWSWAWAAYPGLALIFSAPLFLLFRDGSGWFGSCIIGTLQWTGMTVATVFCREVQLICASDSPWLS